MKNLKKIKSQTENKLKEYEITSEQISSITDVETAFGTTRFLPAWDEIPDDYRKGNIYTDLAKSLFEGKEIKAKTISIDDSIDSKAVNKCVTAHLTSFEPNHEHKIAGVGFMISKIGIVT